METPITIINNTHLELTRVVKIRGTIFTAKKLIPISEVQSIEASCYFESDQEKACTKITQFDGECFKVKEKYKHLKETYICWLSTLTAPIDPQT